MPWHLSAIKAWHYMKSCSFSVGLNDDFATPNDPASHHLSTDFIYRTLPWLGSRLDDLSFYQMDSE